MAKIVEDAFTFDRFLLMDSRDRQFQIISGIETLAPVNDFVFDLPIDSTQTSFLAIHSCNVENHFNNINTYNNRIKITIPGNVTTYTIPVGNYTIAAMITAINSAIGASGITVTISSLTGLVTITGATSFDWSSDNAGSDKYILPSMLGFTVYPITASVAITAINKPSLFYTRFLDFQSSRLTAYQISDESTSKKTRNNILRFFVNYTDDVLTFENRLLNKYKFEDSSNIGLADIRVVDEWGQPALLLGDFTFNVMLFKKTNIFHKFSI